MQKDNMVFAVPEGKNLKNKFVKIAAKEVNDDVNERYDQ